MFRFTTTKQVLFECKARVHLLYVKRLQLISERSVGREFLCGTFLSAQESTICHYNIKKNEHYKIFCWAESPTYSCEKPDIWHEIKDSGKSSQLNSE